MVKLILQKDESCPLLSSLIGVLQVIQDLSAWIASGYAMDFNQLIFPEQLRSREGF